MMTILEELKKKFKNRLLFKENLAKYTWFNTGGNAEVFFKPDNQEDLVFFFKKSSAKKNNNTWSWFKYINSRWWN